MSDLVTPAQEAIVAPGLSPPLESLRHSVQGLVSGQLRGQMRLLFTRLSSLSRLGKVTLGAGAGLLFWWLFVRQGQKAQRPPASVQSLRKKRGRQSSTSTWQLTSDSGSVSGISRPSYNWAELQKASVSDQVSSQPSVARDFIGCSQDSVVSGATLVDGTQLAPQQLGLMGMEALETVIRYMILTSCWP